MPYNNVIFIAFSYACRGYYDFGMQHKVYIVYIMAIFILVPYSHVPLLQVEIGRIESSYRIAAIGIIGEVFAFRYI